MGLRRVGHNWVTFIFTFTCGEDKRCYLHLAQPVSLDLQQLTRRRPPYTCGKEETLAVTWEQKYNSGSITIVETLRSCAERTFKQLYPLAQEFFSKNLSLGNNIRCWQKILTCGWAVQQEPATLDCLRKLGPGLKLENYPAVKNQVF